MATVAKYSRLLAVRGQAVQSLVSRGMASPAPWNYLWKPAPFPENDDARKAAAKKYGLILEDYNPYPHNGEHLTGDYPALPLEPMEVRAGLRNWDYPEYKRNYGEPLHEAWDMYQETRFSPAAHLRYTRKQMVMVQAGLLFTTLFLFELCEGDQGMFGKAGLPTLPRFERPVLEQQLGQEGVVHYTFEPADE